MGHNVNHIFRRNRLTSNLNNQIRQPLSGKKLVNAVRVFINGMGKIAIIEVQRGKSRSGNAEATGAGPQHIRDRRRRVGKGPAPLGKTLIKCVLKVIVLVLKRPFSVITQRLFIRLVIFLVRIIGKMRFVTQLPDFLPVALLVRPVVSMRNRFISPVKRDDGGTPWSDNSVVFPFVGVKILPVKSLTQPGKYTFLLVLVGFTHVVHAMDEDHNAGHRARYPDVARLGDFAQGFVYRNIAF